MSPLGAFRFRARGRIPEPPEEPPPTPTGTFNLVGDPAFNPAAPVLKNGVVLTGTALAAWQGLNWLISESSGVSRHSTRYIEDGGSTLTALATRDGLYHYARTLATIYGDLFVIFRLTGDLRFLDEICRIAELQATELAIGWRGYDPAAAPWPRHNYRCWVSDSAGGVSGKDLGTDTHNLNSPRTHEPLFHLLYALKLNEHLTSPNNGAGYYAAQASFWETYLRDYVRVWRGPEQHLGRDANGNPASGWSVNYRGQLHDYYYDLHGDRRAGSSTWPMQSRHHMHSHVGATASTYWMGKSLEDEDADFQGAASVAIHGINELLFERNMFNIPTRYGNGIVWPRSLHDTGHGTLSSPQGNYAEGTLYMGYSIHNLTNMWLEGVIPDYSTVMAAGAARTWNEWLFRGISSSQGMHISMLQDLAFTGGNAPTRVSDGQRLDFISSAGQSGTSVNPRSIQNLVSWSGNLLMAWDTDDDHFEEHVWGQLGSGGDFGRMDASSAFYDSGGTPLSRPKVLSPSIGLLLKHAGAKDWQL